MTAKTGLCSLVGAGPGDPGLVTLRARACLEQAEVIVYDQLANPALLRWAPATVELIDAGKKSGAHALPQEEINRLLVERTKAGLRVVRLKGGDPFLFGRGGEEAEELAAAGLAFEIVPGVSSALAGPAYAGIPLTHRDHASEVTIFTGHEDPRKESGAVAYAEVARRPGTKVMLMGLERLAAITAAMLAGGADPKLAVAVIHAATTGRQRTLRSTLASVAEEAVAQNFRPPALVVFGGVTALRDQLNWFETRPLFGERIVVTRTQKQAGVLSEALRQLGADAYELPTIRIEPPRDVRGFGELVRDSHQYDWIVFTSPNGVDAFFEMFYKLYDDAREIGGTRIAAIGPTTAQRVRAFHLKVDLQPAESVAEGVVAAFVKDGSVENLRILLARAEVARDVLPRELTKLGAIVDEALAYRTVPETGDAASGIRRFREEGAEMVTFTSSSTVENFLALGLTLPEKLLVASIGPVTSKTLRDAGLHVDVEAKKHDVPGLVDAISRFYRGRREKVP